MADAYVQLAADSTGKKVQTYENTVNGQTVEAQAVVQVDSTGAPLVAATGIGTAGPTVQRVCIASDNFTGAAATYSGIIFTYAIPATPTDMIVLGGSATKTIRLLRLVMHYTITSIAQAEFFLIRRSSVNSGGTTATTNRTINLLDSVNAAASATLVYYTANATSLGTSAAIIKRSKVAVPTPTTFVSNDDGAMLAWDFAARGATLAQLPTIRGTSESLSLNFNGATLGTGFAIQFVEFLWRED